MTGKFLYWINRCQANREKPLMKQESVEHNKVYSFFKRVENHNINVNHLPYRLAKMIWRRNKGFEELYSDLQSLIF